MTRNLIILIVAALVIALPFLFRTAPDTAAWEDGDPVLVIITPMNEAIRYEFARGFSSWHEERFGTPVQVDWRAVGGTSEIMRYLGSEYISAVRAWWKGLGNPWPPGAGESMIDRKFDPKRKPDGMDETRWREICRIHEAFRETDDPDQFTVRIDLLFGGGEYENNIAYRQGLTVPPWPPGEAPEGLFKLPDGTVLIPERISGETCRTPYLQGTVLSTFGICYNVDRLADLRLPHPPTQWRDLTDPAFFGQIGVADPTKSGSIAKAFEMIIQQQCHEAVTAAGFTAEQIDQFEALFRAHEGDADEIPEGVPAAYQQAIEDGWLTGMRLIQQVGANARYFTDSAGKVPVDVSQGDAAAGVAIDFYGRYQAERSRAPDGQERMVYVTPVGGSSVGADPVSLLRGAEHRELAVRFIEYLLSKDGQRLWSYRPGTPGGPQKFALRRLPIRRDFYPAENPTLQQAFLGHIEYAADDLANPAIDPYALSRTFTYRPRWTAPHFGVQRYLVRAMCLDSADELKRAWRAVIANGGPARQPEAMRLLQRMPDTPRPVNWRTAPALLRSEGQMDCMRAWTDFFRNSYREAERAVTPDTGPRRAGGSGDA